MHLKELGMSVGDLRVKKRILNKERILFFLKIGEINKLR